MTRKRNSPQKNQKQYSLPQNYRFGLQSDVRKPIQKHNYKPMVDLEKSIKDSRGFMTAVFRSNQAEIKNQLNEMQSKLEVLTTSVNVVEERVSDIDDKLMARKETEEQREKSNTGSGG